jgi:hypothetical protein
MVPKLDQQRGYVSKPRILLYCLVAVKQGKEPATGQVMRQARGRELRQITLFLLLMALAWMCSPAHLLLCHQIRQWDCYLLSLPRVP